MRFLQGAGLTLLLALAACGSQGTEQAPRRMAGEERALDEARAMLEERREPAARSQTALRESAASQAGDPPAAGP